MRMDDSGFRPDDIENCDRIAELLQELVNRIKKLKIKLR